MGVVTELRCDRCGTVMSENRAGTYGRSLTLGYHHPIKLDLCKPCEGAFCFWLGKHPAGTPLDRILEGHASGDGYPSRGQIAMERRARGLPPWCPVCMREGKMPPGVLEDSSPGGTETFSCGHTIGK